VRAEKGWQGKQEGGYLLIHYVRHGQKQNKKNSVGAKLYGLGANKQIEREREGEREEKD